MPADIVLQHMQKSGVPMTRANYLHIAYFANPPQELGAEEEAALPEMFQRWDEE
jgi:hypothetical protein